MNTNEKTQLTGKRRSLRDSLRYVWQDAHRASQSMARLTPYDDYLQNHRSEY